MAMKRLDRKSSIIPIPERDVSGDWGTALATAQLQMDSKDVGLSELALGALDRSRRFERLVIAMISLEGLAILVAAVPWFEARFPFVAELFGRTASLGAWQVAALFGGALWLVYVGISYRRMRRAEHWIIKSYLVDAWLDRQPARD